MEGKDVGAWEILGKTASVPEQSSEVRTRKPRGFAAMSPERQREIASKGGRTSHARGTGHEWSSEAAREAGRKGGLAGKGKVRRRRKNTDVARNAAAPVAATTPDAGSP